MIALLNGNKDPSHQITRMSLTTLLEQNPDIRARFLKHFQKPHFHPKGSLLAPPLTESYGLAGTAFDYALRFYVQKINPCAKASGWVAELGLERLCRGALERLVGSDVPLLRSQGARPPRQLLADAEKARRIIQDSKERYKAFLRSKNATRPPRELIEAAVRLARFDVIYRAGLLDLEQIFAPVPKLLADDLEAMVALVQPRLFQVQRRCVLNPTFGSASALVGGADGDLLIDDTIIDVKTTKHLTFDREIFNQIIGYYVLACIGGVERCGRPKIKHVGVYYARYGILHSIPIADCIKASDLPSFIRWFTRRARQRPQSI
jgi:hypothetical protein